MPSLFGKRKFSRDDDDHCDYASSKQVKLATALSAFDSDSAMSDVQNLVNVVSFPSYSSHATDGLSINTTTTNNSPNYCLSSLPSSSSPVPLYPAFELYPEVEVSMDVDMDASSTHIHHHSSLSSVDYTPGLMQPTSSTALSHGGNCTQIPRLRMSSHAGLNGSRTLWSHCESCGAIEMVKA